ncbi:uncharacterized protein LOC113795768 [Dermatophagoides pteronyssinus]|uniref:uncharacterized protein LOC113795768 n=1 Tax=Dermatophagoides pteronyssinus TaxID=6956 RepID=UPI003F6775CD
MNNNNNGYQSNDKLSKNFNDNDDQDDKKLLKIKTVTAACVGGDNNHYQSSSIKHLIDAAIQNNIEMINTYHQTFNIPVDSIDENGHTALIYASRNGNVNAVRRFIELNANVDYQEPFEFNTALHYAAQCGHTRTAELLINFGNANTKIKNKFGKTPFELAKDFGHGNNKIMKSLFNKMINSSTTTADNNNNNDDNENIGGYLSLIKTKKMFGGSSTSIDSGFHLIKNECFDLNNNNNHHNHQNELITSSESAAVNCQNSQRKNISYLPHITLLERFSKFGCYRLMGDGYGFELLARNGSIAQMIDETFDNLQIPKYNFEWLLISLEKIVNDLQLNDYKLTSKEYQDFNQEQHTDPQRVNNLYAYNLWRKENLDKILKMIQFIQNGGGFEYQHLENY